jgi:amino acid adenylation domain-containing protein
MTLVHRLRQHAQDGPARPAFTFLRPGGQVSLTYGELDACARRVAALLRARSVGHEPVVLLFPPGLDLIGALFGCMYAGAIPVPTTDPGRLTRTAARLTSILRDVRPRLGLTAGPARRGANGGVDWLATDTAAGSEGAAPTDPDPHDLALIQYTSGSTTAPKGVLLTHCNLIHNQRQIHDAFGQTGQSVFAGWLPPYHDMGLIGLIMHPVYLGAHCVLLAPGDFLRRPFRWLEAISRNRATATAAPDFAFDYCADRVTPAERDRLDLSSLQAVVNGAEPVRPQTLERFGETFAPCGFRPEAFYPCYGLAEATLLVSGRKAAPGGATGWFDAAALERHQVVPRPAHAPGAHQVECCGLPAVGLTVRIIDPATGSPCRPGRVGEIWVAGDSVGAGYWRRPRYSKRVFQARVAPGDGKCYLRTGDLGFLEAAGLFVTGRRSDLIVIRGRNLYPLDVERTVEQAHAAVRPRACIAFGVETTRGERLVVAAETRERTAGRYEEIATAVRRAVGREHDVEIHALLLLPPNELPVTSSGKVRRRACRDAFVAGRLRVLHRDEAELWGDGEPDLPELDLAGLAELPKPDRLERVLHAVRQTLAALLGVPGEEIDPGRTVVELGLDSLTAVRFQYCLEKVCGFAPPAAHLLGRATIAELAAELACRVPAAPPGTRAESGKQPADSAPLSWGQLALWFEYERHPESSAYHVGGAVRVHGLVNDEALARAFGRLRERYPTLRSTFVPSPAGLVQRAGPARADPVEVQDATGWDEPRLRGRLAEEWNRPFDLSAEPPVRFRLYRTHPSEVVLLLTAHHIAADYLSLEILARDWAELYRAEAGGLVPVLGGRGDRHADYLRWYDSVLGGPEGDRLRGYWEQRLSGEPPPLEFYSPRPEPGALRAGCQCYRRLDESLAAGLKAVARVAGVTPFVVYLAAFKILLYRYTHQGDIRIGTSMSVRPTHDFEGAVGYYANTVVLRSDVRGDTTVAEFLRQVSETTLGAMDHAAYPYALLVRHRRAAGAGSTPLFHALFAGYGLGDETATGLPAVALQLPGERMRWGDWQVETLRLERSGSQCELALAVAGCASGAAVALEYDATRFSAAGIEQLLAHYEALLRDMAHDLKARIGDLRLLSPDEEARLDRWNATDVCYPEPHLLHALFEAQARRTPAATALLAAGRTLDYTELDRWSDDLARRLVAAGAGPGKRVAILLQRGPEMVAGLLGVLKARAAYVPILPDYGDERIRWLLGDACPAAVMTTPDVRGRVPPGDYAVLSPDPPRPGRTGPGDRLPPGNPDAPAYVMYTSGTSGQPKGVVVSHRAICNRLLWMRDEYPLTPDDRVLHKAPYTFDVSLWELFLPLVSGAPLVLAGPGEHRDPSGLVRLIQEYGVTVVHFVPSLLRVFLDEPGVEHCDGLRRVFCSGEALPGRLRDLFFRRLGAELHNLYGPTEAAVDVTHWACRGGETGDRVPIGRPIANVQVHVLDPEGKRLPPGVPGELYISGVALALEYWRRPELTAERLVNLRLAPGRATRAYRTGDRACLRTDGSLDFLGRLDDQVKIRGVRVEPAEVEASLRRHPAVRDCAVVAVPAGSDGPRLVAYVVPAADRPPAAALRGFLRQRLPDAFLPARFCYLPALPVLANGKVDRRALLTPPPGDDGDGSAEPCATSEEQALADVWGRVLRRDHVGPHDNFFELGGDSLYSLQVRAQLLEAGYELSVKDLFAHPTLRDLAGRLRRTDGPVRPPVARPPFGLLPEEIAAALRGRFDNAFPLSRLQEALVFHSRSGADYEVYVLTLTVRAPLDVGAIRAGLAALVRRHEMLRVGYNLTEFDRFVQCVHATAEIPVEVHDLTGRDPGEQERILGAWVEAERTRPFDWSAPPLLRMRLDRRAPDAFQLSVSHPLFDGWSLVSLLVELLGDYRARLAGAPPAPPTPLRLSYADFVAAERAALDSPACREFWRARLAGPVAPAASGGAAPTLARRRREVAVPDSVARGLREAACAARVPLKNVLLAAHLAVRRLLSETAEVTTGMITHGRAEEPDGDRVVGLFLNTLPLRLRLGDETWTDLARRALAAEQECWPFRHYPYTEIRTLAGGAPFDVVFNFVHFHNYAELLHGGGPEIFGWRNPSDFTFFPLAVYFIDDPVSSRLLFFIDHDARAFDPGRVERLAGYYSRALDAAAADPAAPVAAANLLADAETAALRGWNDTAREFDMPRQPIHRLIAQRAAERPDAPAVAAAGAVHTYGELDRRAEGMAGRLRALGLPAGSPVGLHVDRTVDLVVALLGILKSGGAFVPLGPTLPAERLAEIIRDAGVRALVADRPIPLPDEPGDLPVLAIGAAEPGAAGPPGPAPDLSLDGLAYIIYTSGSTGRPKGVEVTHGALRNSLLAVRDVAAVTAADTWLALTPLTFDIAVLELLLPLAVGAKVVLAGANEACDGQRLAALLAGSGATIVQATPSTWRLVLEAGWTGSEGLRILCGGEPLSRGLADQLLSRAAAVWNVYGPTEATIWASAARVEPGDEDPSIGRPLANTALYLLDESLRAVPVYVAGEVYLGGAGVARGYHGLPDLTAERFVSDPFVARPGARMYRTGDRGRRRADGAVILLGRRDAQVKVRGVRIEPEEIEAHLTRHPGVCEAVVVVRTVAGDDQRLTAYVRPSEGPVPSAAELGAFLAGYLPGYMIPTEYRMLAAPPLTPNGKLDREALARAGRTAPAEPVLPPPVPSGATEERIAAVWREVLGVSAIGRDDSFFLLGGHSLLAMRAGIRLEREFGRPIPPALLFQYPTVATLARHLERGDGPPRDVGGRARLRERRAEELRATIERRKQSRVGRDPE